MDENSIKKYLKEHLSEKRYNHSLLVAEEAIKLSKIYDVDTTKAYLVGLGHDVAKYFDDEENLKWIRKYNLPKRYLDESYKKILHSIIGSLVAKELFSFSNDMCSAIKYHTIGNPNMNTFDKVIFIADKIGRVELSEEMLETKELAYAGKLDDAIISYLDLLNNKLANKGLKMHKDTALLYKLLKSNKKIA